MGPIGRTQYRLGSLRETIRGRIIKATPSSRYFFGLLSKPAKFTVLFDDARRHAIDNKYAGRFYMPITQGFLWRSDATLPKVGTRLWVEYAIAGPLEEFIGAQGLAIASFGFIEDESALYGNEDQPLEPLIPQLIVQPPIAVC